MSSLPGLGRLKGKVVIVTGAGAGFGQAIVKKVTEEGAKALAVDMHGENAKETADAMPKGSCVAFTGNVTSEADWRRMLEITMSELGPPDVLVNCAGVIHNAAPSHTVAEEQYDLIMAVNVKPLYLSTKVIVAYWKENGHKGLVINLSSTGESRPRPNLVWYNASKGAVTVATKGLAAEYAADKIRFNCIRPALGETQMLARVLGGQDTPEGRQKILGSIPLGRMCQPEDVSNMVCFLSSDEALYITGTAFDVDGGRGVA